MKNLSENQRISSFFKDLLAVPAWRPANSDGVDFKMKFKHIFSIWDSLCCSFGLLTHYEVLYTRGDYHVRLERKSRGLEHNVAEMWTCVGMSFLGVHLSLMSEASRILVAKWYQNAPRVPTSTYDFSSSFSYFPAL